MIKSKLDSAFLLILLGILTTNLIGNAGSLGMADLIGYIFSIVGFISLAGALKGAGKTGALLIIVSLALTILFSPLYAFSAGISDLSSSATDFINQASSSFGGYLGMPDLAAMDDVVDPRQLNDWFFESFSDVFFVWRIATYISFLLFIAGLISWLTYQPLQRFKSGITVLLVVKIVALLLAFNTNFFELNLSKSASDLADNILNIAYIVGLSLIVTNLGENQKQRNMLNQLILLAIAMIHSMIILTSNSGITIIVAMAASLIILIATSKIKESTGITSGTGGLVAYSILVIVASFSQLIPIAGNFIAFPFLTAAYIVLSASLMRLNSTPIFNRIQPNGMKSIATVAAFCIGGALVAIFPLVGNLINSVVFMLIMLPIMLLGWYNAFKTQLITLPDDPCDDLNKAERVQIIEVVDYQQAPKYPIEPVIHVSDPIPTPIVSQPVDPEKSKRDNKILAAVLGGVLLIAGLTGGAVYYFNVYIPEKIDREAARYYTFAENTNLRSSKIVSDFSLIGQMQYGAELITYDYNKDWAEVKNSGQKGFVAGDFILPADQFFLLNSIFGDTESRLAITSAKCRRALMDYYIDNYLYGKPNEMMGRYDFHAENWVVYAKPEGSKNNSVFYKRISNANSRFTDFGVIIRNTQSNQKRTLLFGFNDDGSSRLVMSHNTPTGSYINDIYRIGDQYYIIYGNE